MCVPVKNIYKITLQGALAGMMFTIESNNFVIMFAALLLNHVQILLISENFQDCIVKKFYR